MSMPSTYANICTELQKMLPLELIVASLITFPRAKLKQQAC
jgi:hypothetical protein